ncbi:MAG: helix-turn-helix transcriptional regulator [Erysipelotrichaceae bacterium]|nr:helix-turn-helix transcriptional regulator [Erysipelotrichaceae bacterium]
MMTHAYNEMYLNDAMQTLAEVFSLVKGKKEIDLLFQNFIMSGIAYQFGRGNPRYINMPSEALFYEITKYNMHRRNVNLFNRSREYWCGFVLAYYQWYTGMSFEQIGKRLPPSKILDMYYPLHEASLDKFVEVANSIVLIKETNLSIYRKYAGLSQIQLAFYSGVELRNIRAYEQRTQNINEASSIKLFKLSRVLGCNMEDLLELQNENK